MDAFQTASRSRAAQLEDTAREATMAARLAEFREDGTGGIVAVVGIDHVDTLAERLEKPDEWGETIPAYSLGAMRLAP